MDLTPHLKRGNDFLRKRMYDKAFLEYFLFKEKNDEIKKIIEFNFKYAEKRMDKHKDIEIKLPVFGKKDLLYDFCQNIIENIDFDTHIEIQSENMDECVISLKIDSKNLNDAFIADMIIPSAHLYFSSTHRFLLNDQEIEYKKYIRYTKKKNVCKNNNIVYICDKNFIEPTIVSINSCLKNIKKIDNIYIIAVNCADFFINK